MEEVPQTGTVPPPVPSDPFKTLCRSCGRPIEFHFAFCPYCGKRQREGDAWFYDPVWIAVLGLFVIGPFALPLVWRSKRMGRWTKLAYTGVLVVYTVITAEYLMQAITYSLGILDELNGLMY